MFGGYLVSWVPCACIMGYHITGARVTTHDCWPIDRVMLKSSELSHFALWCMNDELCECCKGRSGQG